MKEGASFAGLRIERVVEKTLFRVVDENGRSSWMRTGTHGARARAEAFVNARVEGFGPFELFEQGDRVGLVLHAPVGTPVTAVSQARLFPCLQRLARLMHALHQQGLVLGALNPAGFRVEDDQVIVVPMLDPRAPWVAPEGPGAPPGDWFLLGLQIYAALTGLNSFDWYGTVNAPDPRDRAPRSPEVLSALAIDLLLLDPNERPDGREVLDELVEPSEGPVEDAIDRLMREGGLAVLSSPWASRLEELDRAMRMDGGETVQRLVESVSALPKRARTRIAALLQHPEALSPAHRARASRQLGQALAIAGVQLAWWDRPDEVQRSVLVDVLRARPCPAVAVLSDEPLDALVDVCVASGIRVDGDHRAPSAALGALPFQERDAVLWSGSTEPLGQQLVELGVPRRQGLAGRAFDAVADLVGPRGSAERLTDASRPRRASALAAELAWVAPERAVLVARWARREAMRAGDPEAGAVIHLVDAALTGNLPPGEPDSEYAEDIQVFGRALTYRHRGDAKAVVGVLDDVLPLASLGPAENGAAGLLVAEALIEAGSWKRANLVLRSLQVQARTEGNRLLDLACTTLAVCMGFPTPHLERLAAEVDVGSGVLAWWLARARALHRVEEPAEALEIVRACRVFERWPLRVAGAPAVEARMFVQQLAWATGEPVQPLPYHHPSAEAWRALADAVDARRRGDVAAVHTALDQAAKRFEGASALLKAAAVNRLRGQWLGGARGGNLIAQADAVFLRQGVANPALILPRLLPALAQRRL